MQLFENTFAGAINGDIDSRMQKNNTYRSAKNIEIVGTSNLYVAKNLAGTSEVCRILSTVASNNFHILGAYSCIGSYQNVYTTNGSLVAKELNNSIVFVSYDNIDVFNIKHRIYLYDIIRDSLHILVDTPTLGLTSTSVLDAIVYTEQEESSLFFVDNLTYPKKVKCVVTSSSPITSADTLSIRRFFPSNKLTILSVEEGGKLYSGSYQFCYRFFSISDYRYSAWSLISDAVPVTIDGVQSDPSLVYGGVAGALTNKKIKFSIDTPFNSSIYNAIQVAVIKNISGANNPELTAYTLNPSTEMFADPSSIYYDGSSIESQIPISDIVIEDAAIKTFKTITLKNNRLIAGNIQYNGLDYDRGDITITDAYTIKQQIGHVGFKSYTAANTNSPSITPTSQVVIYGTPAIVTIGSDVVEGNVYNYHGFVYIAKRGDTAAIVTKALFDLIPSTVISYTMPTTTSIRLDLPSGSLGFTLTASVALGYGDNTTAPVSPYGYKNEINTVNYRGHFRGEVYRYGITYVDEFANWSKPQVLDFSQFSIFQPVGTLNNVFSFGTTVANVSDLGAKDGSSYIEARRSSISATGVKPGHYIYISGSVNIENNGYFKVTGLVPVPLNRYKIYVDATLISEGSLGSGTPVAKIQVTGNSKYNHAELNCIDWKYPSREVAEFTILDGSSRIQSLGLRLTGIKNHPTWAVGMAIVRAKRNKNILLQSPHIPVNAIQQALSNGDFDFAGNTNGIYSTKNFIRGAARNICRGSADTTTHSVNECEFFNQNGTLASATMPLSYIVPPEYMFNTSGQSFYNYEFKQGDTVKVVDAVALHSTAPANNTSNSNTGTASNQSVANEYYAESKDNYYNDGSGKNLLQFYNQFKYYFGTGSSKIREVGFMETSGTPYTFSYFPTSSNLKISSIDSFGDYDSISNSQTGSVPKIQKGIILGLNDNFGDLTNISLNTTVDGTIHLSNEIKFDNNVDDSAVVNNRSSDATNNAIVTPSALPSSSTVIVNVERGLSDNRYGDKLNFNEFIFTGSYVALSESDITNNTPVDIDVWGGDCFISKASFKLSSSQFGIGFDDAVHNSLGNEMLRAMGYTDFIEFITCYLESEVNCEFNAQKYVPVKATFRTIEPWRVDQVYPYNNGYSIQNILKVFVPTNPLIVPRNEFPSRIAYSDQKIYQSNIQGFDRFRAESVYDQDETYGPITKLARIGNGQVYSLQYSGVSRIPIQANIIEDAVGNNLEVRSGEIIGQPQYISVNTGCQHLLTVAIADKDIFFTDIKNKAVVRLGDGFERISEHGAINYFNSKFNSFDTIPEFYITGHYDFNRKEYIINKRLSGYNLYSNGAISSTNVSDPFVFVYNGNINKWVTEFSTSSDIDYKRMIYAGRDMYTLGMDSSSNMTIHKMYDVNAQRGSLLGHRFDSEIVFIINPDVDIPKVFSNVSLNATNRAKGLDMVTFRENSTLQQVLGMNFDVLPRESMYRIPTLRDSNESRLRGLLSQATLIIDNTTINKECRIYSFITKYRHSFRPN